MLMQLMATQRYYTYINILTIFYFLLATVGEKRKREHLLFEALTQFMKRSALHSINEIVGYVNNPLFQTASSVASHSVVTKASFRLGTHAPCSGTKMDVVQTRQCPELKMFIRKRH